MIIKDIMKYLESEYLVISYTPCEICGGDYITRYSNVILIDDIPYDICDCICSNCGHEKTFQFCAPFIKDESMVNIRTILN
ncbi:metal-binding protein [Clostridium sp. WILCCON 0269]|uniref:Metal-binding protein n=1 Tax=Candidatus Clostridium eludens TaxID=3381663 RepID=A0ABW8SHW6_9CLOT